MGWSQAALAKSAKIGLGTVQRMEKANDSVVCSVDTLTRVHRALNKAGVHFLNDSSPGVRLVKPGT